MASEAPERLSGSDMSNLLAERGPIHVHVGATIIVEGAAPGYEQLIRHVADPAAEQVERLLRAGDVETTRPLIFNLRSIRSSRSPSRTTRSQSRSRAAGAQAEAGAEVGRTQEEGADKESEEPHGVAR